MSLINEHITLTPAISVRFSSTFFTENSIPRLCIFSTILSGVLSLHFIDSNGLLLFCIESSLLRTSSLVVTSSIAHLYCIIRCINGSASSITPPKRFDRRLSIFLFLFSTSISIPRFISLVFIN